MSVTWTNAIPAFLLVGGFNSSILFTAQAAGTAGNSITITIVVSGDNTALSSSNSGNNITINLATNANGVATSTANQVIANVNGTSGPHGLVQASKGSVGAGLGLVAALTQTNLAGGVAASSPNWTDAIPAKEGWRSSKTGEILVSQSPGAISIPSTQATVKNAYIVGDSTHYRFGNVPDKIVLAVEYTKPVYKVRVNLEDGSSNVILLAGGYYPVSPAAITVNLINPGTDNATLSANYKITPFNGGNLTINVYLATNGSAAVTSTYSQVNTYCTNNSIPLQLASSGTVTPAVLSGPWTATADTAPSIPITVGTNVRSLTFMRALERNFGLTNQNSGFDSVLPVPNFDTLLFGYQIVTGDSATANGVHIGSAAAAAHHAFGSSNSEITITATTPGTAGNSLNVVLNAPISANVGAISSSPSGSTITYNLTTSGATAATIAFGSANTEIAFTARALGAAGNSITVTINSGSGALGVVTTVNAVVITLATGGSTVAAVIAACAADSTTNALIVATTTGNGSGTTATETITSLATGTNASSSTTVAQLIAFIAADPNSASFGVTSSTTGNGTGNVAGASSTALSGGSASSATITYPGSSTFVDEQNAAIATALTPPVITAAVN